MRSYPAADAAAMRANIERANDVILAEAAVFGLAAAIPRPKAEELVKKACRQAVAENKPLVEIVKRLAQDEGVDGAVDWQSLSKPENYIGQSNKIIDRVLEQANKFSA